MAFAFRNGRSFGHLHTSCFCRMGHQRAATRLYRNQWSRNGRFFRNHSSRLFHRCELFPNDSSYWRDVGLLRGNPDRNLKSDSRRSLHFRDRSRVRARRLNRFGDDMGRSSAFEYGRRADNIGVYRSCRCQRAAWPQSAVATICCKGGALSVRTFRALRARPTVMALRIASDIANTSLPNLGVDLLARSHAQAFPPGRTKRKGQPVMDESGGRRCGGGSRVATACTCLKMANVTFRPCVDATSMASRAPSLHRCCHDSTHSRLGD